jgi:hypothetical protein
VNRKRKHAMTIEREKTHKEDTGEEIVQSFQQLDATQASMLEKLGGPLSQEQQDSLADLLRLDDSLGGPDDTLDQELYSRAFPPVSSTTTKRTRQ